MCVCVCDEEGQDKKVLRETSRFTIEHAVGYSTTGSNGEPFFIRYIWLTVLAGFLREGSRLMEQNCLATAEF